MTDYSSPANETSLLLMQARYVLRNLDIERPGCGYAKMAAVCEEAAGIHAQQMPWQPIETAPKDGSRILICREDRFPRNTYVVRWLKDVWNVGPIGGEWNAYPTHWMPLPAGPSFTSPGCRDLTADELSDLHADAVKTSQTMKAAILPQSTPEPDTLLAALEQSVTLQSHYAELLNMHDGGKRRTFASAREWVDRLFALTRPECGSGAPSFTSPECGDKP